MAHSLDEMLFEAAKLHAQQLGNMVRTMVVCQRCRLNPIQVIARPPTFDVELLNDQFLTAVGYPARNPFNTFNHTMVRITEIVQFLCGDCARQGGP